MKHIFNEKDKVKFNKELEKEYRDSFIGFKLDKEDKAMIEEIINGKILTVTRFFPNERYLSFKETLFCIPKIYFKLNQNPELLEVKNES